MLQNQKKKKLPLLKSFYDFSLELISLRNNRIIKFKTENKILFKKLKNTTKRFSTVTNNSNDTSLF